MASGITSQSLQAPAHAHALPLSARSVALSLLIGSHPPAMAARDLTALGDQFGISAGTMRVALSRMAGSGELVLSDATYTLSPRHLKRQAATDALLHPRRRRYEGAWRMGVIVDRGRPAADRTALRTALARGRFAELREGVWLRPDNLAEPDPPALTDMRVFSTRPPEDRALVRELWDLDKWASRARQLMAALGESADPMERLAAAAAAVRHLCTDPVLPAELAPDDWPGDELRRTYDDYRRQLALSLQPPAKEKP